MLKLIETLNSTENHKNVIPSSVSPGAKKMLRSVISVMNILGKKAQVHTTFISFDGCNINDVYVKTEGSIILRDCLNIDKVVNNFMIIPSKDSLFILIN